MKAVRLLEDTVIAGIMRPRGSIVYVPDDFVQGAIPVFLSDDDILQTKLDSFAAEFSADLAAGRISIVNMQKNVYCFTRWGTDAEGDAVAVDTMTVKKKTLAAMKDRTQTEKAASAAAYNSAIDTINAMIAACV